MWGAWCRCEGGWLHVCVCVCVESGYNVCTTSCAVVQLACLPSTHTDDDYLQDREPFPLISGESIEYIGYLYDDHIVVVSNYRLFATGPNGFYSVSGIIILLLDIINGILPAFSCVLYMLVLLRGQKEYLPFPLESSPVLNQSICTSLLRIRFFSILNPDVHVISLIIYI